MCLTQRDHNKVQSSTGDDNSEPLVVLELYKYLYMSRDAKATDGRPSSAQRCEYKYLFHHRHGDLYKEKTSPSAPGDSHAYLPFLAR